MTYDKGLAQRVTELLEEKPGFNEKKMFGGVCYLLNGNMACGVLNEDLIVRVGPEKYEDLLKLPHTRKFDFTFLFMRFGSGLGFFLSAFAAEPQTGIVAEAPVVAAQVIRFIGCQKYGQGRDFFGIL